MSGQGTSLGWEAFLEEGETILWQGRPDGSFSLAKGEKALALFGAVFAGFALVWMLLASLGGGYFWMFGMLHFAVGDAILVGALLVPTFIRRRTWYTLTDRRAFIARDLPFRGRTLTTYPITAESRVTRQGRNVFFATRKLAKSRGGSRTARVGFERLEDAGTVFDMVRQVQKRQDDGV